MAYAAFPAPEDAGAVAGFPSATRSADQDSTKPPAWLTRTSARRSTNSTRASSSTGRCGIPTMTRPVVLDSRPHEVCL